jgi:predicted lipoprotein with Yx(FWY)xxD motif
VSIRLIAAVIVLAAVCAAPVAAGAQRAAVAIKPSSFGRILFDGRGFVLYAFTRDRHGKSSCSGACAAAWPPYIVKSGARAGAGIAARRLGTTRRPDGSLQVTYAGRPLYYYVGDRRPGQILCQGVSEYGGIWRVVRPSGELVKRR